MEKTVITDKQQREKIASKTGAVGIFLNVLLFLGKLAIGILSTSVAIIADAFNNIFDAGSAIISLIGIRLANKPVDKEHPLGHGRFEYVSAFIVDMIIVFVGYELFKTSLEKILHPTLPNVNALTYVILILAILIKFGLFCYYRHIGTMINSASIKGASIDSIADCIATSLVLISAIISKTFQIAIDGWAGIVVAVFILYSGIKTCKETIDLLLGRPPEKEFVDSIYAFCENYKHIAGIHDVIVHDYGVGRQIISFHAEVPADWDINLAHEEIDQLEQDMHHKFGAIVTVHLDPIVVNDPVVNELRDLVNQCVKAVNEDFSAHDFRMTKGENWTNLIFDLLIPADSKFSKTEAEKAVTEKIKEHYPNCACVIKVEHPFV